MAEGDEGKGEGGLAHRIRKNPQRDSFAKIDGHRWCNNGRIAGRDHSLEQDIREDVVIGR